jgi:hypothetical protein
MPIVEPERGRGVTTTSNPRVGSRLVATAVAFLVLALAAAGLWWAFRPSAEPIPKASPSGYAIQFPERAGPPGDNPNGGATVTVTTNLPEGTLVWLLAEGVGGQGGNSECCSAIEGGSVTFQVNNGSCYLPTGASRSTGFRMTVKVLPVYRFRHGPVGPGGTPAPDPTQPSSVTQILGSEFEHLDGPQVEVVDGIRQIVASAEFHWPADTCTAMLKTNEIFLPEECQTTDTRGHPLAMIQAADHRSLMDQLMPAIAQIRLCELWSQWMVPAFRKAHPWPEFRDGTKAWIDGLGDLAGSGEEQFTSLTWKFVRQDPERYVADIALRDRLVARVEFVPLPFPEGCRTGCEPFWGITRFVDL